MISGWFYSICSSWMFQVRPMIIPCHTAILYQLVIGGTTLDTLRLQCLCHELWEYGIRRIRSSWVAYVRCPPTAKVVFWDSITWWILGSMVEFYSTYHDSIVFMGFMNKHNGGPQLALRPSARGESVVWNRECSAHFSTNKHQDEVKSVYLYVHTHIYICIHDVHT